MLLLAAGWAVASADSGDSDTFVTRLEPGDNLVGWTSHAAPVEALFEALPQVENVWTWDASWRRWEFASPRLPNRMWTLRTLTPGMGLRVRIGGEQAVDWERPRRPALGTVRLKPGYNLVAWMGRDDVALNHLVRGIGYSLRSVVLGPASSSSIQAHSSEEIGELAEQPLVSFGSALWVEVWRTVHWLQPTGVMPRIILSPTASADMQATIMDDIQTVIDLSSRIFAVEADFTDIVLIVPATIRELLEWTVAHDVPNRDALIDERSSTLTWDNIRAAGYHRAVVNESVSLLMAQQQYWSSSLFMHEYVHALQHQLFGPRLFDQHVSRSTPPYFVEGLARWAQDLLDEDEGRATWAQLKASAMIDIAGAPSLAAVEEKDDGSLEYRLGRAAMHSLVEPEDGHMLLEFYRTVAPDGVGPGFRWLAEPRAWQEAFVDVFGISADRFRSEFDSRPLGETPEAHGHSHPGYVDMRVTLKAVSNDATGGAQVTIVCSSDDGKRREGEHFHLAPGESYVTHTHPDLGCILAVDVEDPACRLYYGADGWAGQFEDATAIRTPASAQRAVTLDLDLGLCRYHVRGRLVTDAGDALGRVLVWLDDSNSGWSPALHVYNKSARAVTTDRDGRFALAFGSEASRQIIVELQRECDVTVATGVKPQAEPILMSYSVPGDQCVYKIEGRLVYDDGEGVENTYVFARGPYAQLSLTRTDMDGQWSLTVEEGVSYALSMERLDCSLRLVEESGDVNGHRGGRTRFEIGGRDVVGLQFVVPRNGCEPLVDLGAVSIKGQLLDHAGNGVAGEWIYARNGMGARPDGITDTDGAFEITIEVEGTYRLDVWPGGCRFFYQRDGIARSWGDATVIQVSNTDVTGIEFRLPEDPASFCD